MRGFIACALLVASVASALPANAASVNGPNPNDNWHPLQLDPRNAGRAATWESCTLTYAVDLGTLVPASANLSQISTEIYQAFARWSTAAAAIGRQLTFVRLPDVPSSSVVFDPVRVEAEPRATTADILVAFWIRRSVVRFPITGRESSMSSILRRLIRVWVQLP